MIIDRIEQQKQHQSNKNGNFLLGGNDHFEEQSPKNQDEDEGCGGCNSNHSSVMNLFLNGGEVAE